MTQTYYVILFKWDTDEPYRVRCFESEHEAEAYARKSFLGNVMFGRVATCQALNIREREYDRR